MSHKLRGKICTVYTRNLVISLFVYFVIKNRGKLDFNKINITKTVAKSGLSKHSLHRRQ